MRTVDRRYLMEFFPAVAAYALIMLLVWPYAERIAASVGRAAIALLPVVPVLLVMCAILRRIRGGDELERRLALESIAIASAVVGIATFAAGFLVLAKVFSIDEAGFILVLPTLFLVYGLARVLLARRYRTA